LAEGAIVDATFRVAPISPDNAFGECMDQQLDSMIGVSWSGSYQTTLELNLAMRRDGDELLLTHLTFAKIGGRRRHDRRCNFSSRPDIPGQRVRRMHA
jgi:hypothetical protein